MSNVPFKAPKTFRETLKFLADRNELMVVKSQVDPIYEIAGIEKALDNGPAIMFENIMGYPDARAAGNVLARIETTAAMFGLSDHRKLKFKGLEAMKSPLPPVVVDRAACQEVVIKDDIDVAATLPLLRHSKDDAGRVLGGGVVLFADPALTRMSDLTFRRMHFRGRDWASMNFNPVSHLTKVLRARKGERIPLTVNVGASPAELLLAGVWAIHMILPDGSDELGVAGALQGSPVEIVKAKTVDAYALTSSEWVIEGYVSPERVWESDEAEKIGKPRVAPFFPEWNGYVGKAGIVPRFQVTAITHRKDRPILYTPLAASFEGDVMSKVLRESSFYEFADRFVPGLVLDANILWGIKVNSGVVFKVKKRGSGDDSLLKNLLLGALEVSMSRLVIAVDDDVNIYSADDVFWAISTRANAQKGILTGPSGSAATGYQLAAYAARSGEGEGGEGIAIDATAPFEARNTFQRAHYPSDSVDLSKHFSKEDIAKIRGQQSEWARMLAEIGG